MLALSSSNVSVESRRFMVAKAVFALLSIRVALKLFPFAKVYRAVMRRGERLLIRGRKSPDQTSVDELASLVNSAARYLPRTTSCLPRAMCCQLLLNEAGYESQLRIGVANMPDGHLKAHAWVEREGSVVLGDLPDLINYRPLPIIETSKP